MADRSRDVLAIQPSTPSVTDHVLLIPVHEIELGERLRPVDPVWAEGLGRLMLAEGQRTPIEVCRLPGKVGYTVVSGGHRRVGAEKVGMAYLKAIVVTSDRANRRMGEVLENLGRKDLEPVDRAAFVAEWHDLLRARDGVSAGTSAQSIAIQARWQKVVKSEAEDTSAKIADVFGWTDEIAAAVGLSRRSIEYDIMLHRRLAPRSIKLLREHRHPVLRNASQLRQLAKLDPAAQEDVVELLCWEGKSLGQPAPKTVAEAMARSIHVPAKKAAPSKPEDKALSAFLGSFGRMSLTEKKGALVQLAGLLTPALVEALAEAIDLPTKPAPAPAQDEKYREELIEAVAQLRELVDGLIEDEVISDGPSAIVDYDRQDRLREANSALQLAAMPLYGNHVPLGDPKATQALQGSVLVLGRLADGAGATDDQIAAAYDACEQALHGCGPAISNDDTEDQA